MATIETDSVAGPASYATGGIVFTTGLSTVDFASVEVSVPGANLPMGEFFITRNSPGAGQFTAVFVRHVYDDLTGVGAMTGLPSGVTGAGTSGQTYDAESAHVHSMAHDHAANTSGDQTGGAGGSSLDVTSPVSISSHTHQFDVPAFVGNTGAGSSHTHQWNSLYQHNHGVSTTTTAAAFSELPNATDLSGATLTWKAVKL